MSSPYSLYNQGLQLLLLKTLYCTHGSPGDLKMWILTQYIWDGVQDCTYQSSRCYGSRNNRAAKSYKIVTKYTPLSVFFKNLYARDKICYEKNFSLNVESFGVKYISEFKYISKFKGRYSQFLKVFFVMLTCCIFLLKSFSVIKILPTMKILH